VKTQQSEIETFKVESKDLGTTVQKQQSEITTLKTESKEFVAKLTKSGLFLCFHSFAFPRSLHCIWFLADTITNFVSSSSEWSKAVTKDNTNVVLHSLSYSFAGPTLIIVSGHACQCGNLRLFVDTTQVASNSIVAPHVWVPYSVQAAVDCVGTKTVKVTGEYRSDAPSGAAVLFNGLHLTIVRLA
jgi:hypothetical protein